MLVCIKIAVLYTNGSSIQNPSQLAVTFGYEKYGINNIKITSLLHSQAFVLTAI